MDILTYFLTKIFTSFTLFQCSVGVNIAISFSYLQAFIVFLTLYKLYNWSCYPASQSTFTMNHGVNPSPIHHFYTEYIVLIGLHATHIMKHTYLMIFPSLLTYHASLNHLFTFINMSYIPCMWFGVSSPFGCETSSLM